MIIHCFPKIIFFYSIKSKCVVCFLSNLYELDGIDNFPLGIWWDVRYAGDNVVIPKSFIIVKYYFFFFILLILLTSCTLSALSFLYLVCFMHSWKFFAWWIFSGLFFVRFLVIYSLTLNSFNRSLFISKGAIFPCKITNSLFSS